MFTILLFDSMSYVMLRIEVTDLLLTSSTFSETFPAVLSPVQT
jgi:hypothetical protein